MLLVATMQRGATISSTANSQKRVAAIVCECLQVVNAKCGDTRNCICCLGRRPQSQIGPWLTQACQRTQALRSVPAQTAGL